MMLGELDDGSAVKIIFWKGQMRTESGALNASQMAEGMDYKIQATPDYTQAEEIQLGYIDIEDAA
jgi:hypothetical protein